MAKQFDLSVLFRVTDKITKPMQKINRSFKDMTKSVDGFGTKAKVAFSKVDVGLRKMDRRFEKTAKRIERSGFTKIGTRMKDVGQDLSTKFTLPLTLFGGLAIKSATDFQKSMNMVGAVTKTTGTPAFERLTKLAKELGATTQFSASEAAEGMKFLGMAGLTTEQIFGALPRTLELAASAQMDLATAADIVTNIMSGFRMETSELSKANDVLVNAFTNSNTDLQQLGEGMKMVGPVAKAMEFRFTETAAALGILAKNAFQGEMGGTGLRRIMTNLMSPSKKASKMIKALGINIKNTDGTIKDITGVLQEFEAAQERGAKQIWLTQTAMEAFGQRGGPQFLALLGAGSKELVKFEDNLRDVGTAARVSEAQMKRLPGAVKLMMSAFEAVQLAIVDSGFGEFIEKLLRGLANMMQTISKTAPWILALGSAFAVLVAIAGPLTIAIGAVTAALGVLGIAAAPVWAVVGAITAFIGLAGAIVVAWEPIKEFFKELKEDIKTTADVIAKAASTFSFKDFFSKESFTMTADEYNRRQAAAVATANSTFSSNSQTDINIKVSSDEGSIATVEGVKKKGDSNVNIATLGYMGVGL